MLLLQRVKVFNDRSWNFSLNASIIKSLVNILTFLFLPSSRYDLGPPIFLGLVGCFLIFLGAMFYVVTVYRVIMPERYWNYSTVTVSFLCLMLNNDSCLSLGLQQSCVCLRRRNVHGPSFQRPDPVHRLLQRLQALWILHGLRTIWQFQDIKDLSDDTDKKIRPGRLRVRVFARGGGNERISTL